MTVVLDADVVIGALDGADLHHSRARTLFRRWHAQQTPRLISVINLSEVLVGPGADRERLRTAREAVGLLGVVIHQPSEPVGVEAARFRARHPISLADAYCLATAKHVGATVISFDRKVTRAAEDEQLAHTDATRRRGPRQ